MFSTPDIMTNIIPHLDVKSILNLLCICRDETILNMLRDIHVNFYFRLTSCENCGNDPHVGIYNSNREDVYITLCRLPLGNIISMSNTDMYMLWVKEVDNTIYKFGDNGFLLEHAKLIVRDKVCYSCIHDCVIDMRGCGKNPHITIAGSAPDYPSIIVYWYPLTLTLISTSIKIGCGDTVYAPYMGKYTIVKQ